jgi:hypothetical protein
MTQEKELWRKELQRKERSLNRCAFMQAYLLMAVTGIGYLALMWSTVVLLGGFVTTLRKKDFWCITVISMMQAARSVMSHLDIYYLHLVDGLLSASSFVRFFIPFSLYNV